MRITILMHYQTSSRPLRILPPPTQIHFWALYTPALFHQRHPVSLTTSNKRVKSFCTAIIEYKAEGGQNSEELTEGQFPAILNFRLCFAVPPTR